MNNIDNVFYNEYRHKAIFDYKQFKSCFITSVRGGAKTYDVQNALLQDYFRRGKFFAVLRESQVELDEMLAGGYWDGNLISRDEYKKHTYQTRGNRIIIDNKVVGVAVALTTYGNFRGVALNLGGEYVRAKDKDRLEKEIRDVEKFVENNTDKLLNIHFDEFEPINPKLNNEKRYVAFKHIAETLFRFRQGVRVYFCGNIENANNAFLEKFGFGDALFLQDGIKKSYLRKPSGKYSPLAVWAHFTPNQQWREMRENSYVGELSLIDNSEMFTTGKATVNIGFKKIVEPRNRYVLYKINTGERVVGVWQVRGKNIYQITSDPKGTSYITFVNNTKDLRERCRLLEQGQLEMFVTLLEAQQLEFENAAVYENFISILPKQARTKKWKQSKA